MGNPIGPNGEGVAESFAENPDHPSFVTLRGVIRKDTLARARAKFERQRQLEFRLDREDSP